MGTDKALLEYRGRTFLETVLATLHEAGIERVAVVLGHHAEEIRRAVNIEGTEIVINPDYRRGQTSSLQAGLKTLCDHSLLGTVAAVSSPPSGDGDIAATGEVVTPTLEAVVLCLVDHPAVSAETIRKLVAAFQPPRSPLAIPTFQGQHGHPVLIGRALFEELKKVSPDEGANAVIRKYRHLTKFIEVDDRGILLDVDDPETYRTLK